MLWPFIVIGAFWLGYLQAHLWPSRKLYVYLEEHTSSSGSKKLKAKPEKPQFKLDVKKKSVDTNLTKDSNTVLQYQKEYCEHCKTYDGHDMCVHYKNFGAVVDKSVNNCIVYRLFKQKEK